MQLLQKLFIPISVVIAGALIAGALIYIDAKKPVAVSDASGATGAVQTPIRGMQPNDHILGDPKAPIVIVEYSDPECPFCKQFETTMQQIMTDYGASGKVAWVYRHFPIPQLHPKAPKEAEALECAAAQGGNDMFWKYSEKVYATTSSNNSLDDGVYNTPATIPVDANGKPYYVEKKPRNATDAGQLSDIAVSLGLDKVAFEKCLAYGTYASRVKTDTAEAMAAGGQGTPFSIILVGGQQIAVQGAQPYATMKNVIDSILKTK